MASFVSSIELNKSRSFKKKEQKRVLEAARTDHEEKEKYKQYQKESGQDEWMLPSLSDRLDREARKHSKHKKKKKKKDRSDSENDSDGGGDNWVEANPISKTSSSQDWMQEDFLSGIKTTSNEEIRRAKKKEDEKKSVIDQLGQSSRELNPYWKSGGTGLPPEASKPSSTNMDASWLRRSLKRMEEQSKETGKSIEDIAAQRYGSWSKFQEMLSQAEGKSSQEMSSDRERSTRKRFRRPDERDVDRGKDRSRYHRDDGWRKKSSTKTQERKITEESSKVDVEKKHRASKNEVKIIPEPSTNTDNSKPSPKPVTELDSNALKVKANSLKSKAVPLTEQEKNEIGAKIIKFEMLGKLDRVEKLKKKLELSRQAEIEKRTRPEQKSASEESNSDNASDEETVVLTRTSNTGQSWPVQKSEDSDSMLPSKRKKKKLMKVHDESGERERYFADDDRYSLKDLVKRERSGAAEDQTAMLSRLSSKMFRGVDGEHFTLDDMFESKAGSSYTKGQEEARHERKAIDQHKKLQRRLEKCKFCLGNPENPKHLILSIGRVSYVRLPSHQPLQENHCIIAPLHHCSTGTALDEDVWSEIRKFMRGFYNMCNDEGDDCVFLQTCLKLKQSLHFHIECIPLPKELGDMAPIYFKKAIQECESEWAQNKKLVDTRGSSVKSKIPAGLPYFAVDFGLDGGFAHVIEDELSFPNYFGREIIGGMLDVEPRLWRKPYQLSFSDQMKLAVKFEKMFRKYDWTVTEI